MSSVYITLINSDTTLDPGYDCYLCDATSNNIVATLPSILGDGQNFIIKRIDVNNLNTLTIDTSDSDTIDGNASIQLSVAQNVRIASYNNNWYTIGGNI